ncbi:MAG TPA: response regulator transcription factor [Mycobacteriales bacterium]|nr:response regulator transcription factor [Mycobacteriales bacterium]
MSAVRLLLVDDHPVFLDGMATLLAGEEWAEVVAVARTGAEALERAATVRADVAVVDLRLPDTDGVELTRRLMARWPDLRVLLLTMHAGQDAVLRGLTAGAAGYVLKDAEPEDVLAAVRQVARGGMVVGAGAVAPVRAHLEGGEDLPGLGSRDRELLELLAQGLPTATIAARLGLAPKTVRNRLSTLYAALGVSDRAEAMLRARSAGLGRAP